MPPARLPSAGSSGQLKGAVKRTPAGLRITTWVPFGASGVETSGGVARSFPQPPSAAAIRVVASTGRTPGAYSLDARPRVGVEVHVPQALGREVRVELGGGDVGVAQHLLDRAQVAAAGQQVG